MLDGKVHNIETIHGKQEQNLVVLIADIPTKDLKLVNLPDKSVYVISFEVPVLIHATVLPPQKEADTLEVGIPKNAKLYVNFIKPHVGQLLKGRFSTDCLFDGENFVPVAMNDDNVDRRIVEHRLTLNFRMYKPCAILTISFVVVGLIIFLKIIFMPYSSSSHEAVDEHRHHHASHTERHDHHESNKHSKLEVEEGAPKTKTD